VTSTRSLCKLRPAYLRFPAAPQTDVEPPADTRRSIRRVRPYVLRAGLGCVSALNTSMIMLLTTEFVFPPFALLLLSVGVHEMATILNTVRGLIAPPLLAFVCRSSFSD
jgi:hypothetical protein